MVEQQGASGAELPADNAPEIPELRTLAALLQQGREAKGLSLVALSQRLHMGLEQLEALESGDSARLSEPVFVIAQARRVAECLGLEIGPQIEALRRSEAFNAAGPALRSDAFKPVVPKPVVPRPAATQAPKPQLAKPQLAKPQTPKARPAAAKSGASGPSRLGWILPLLLLGAGLAAAAVLVPREQVLVVLTPLNGLLPAKPVAPEPPVAPKPEAKPQPVATELLLIAPQTSWLEVRSMAGGRPLFRGMLKGEKRFPLGSGIRLLAGRPNVVRVSLGSAPPKVLGTVKDIRWFTFTSQGQTAQPQANKPQPSEPQATPKPTLNQPLAQPSP